MQTEKTTAPEKTAGDASPCIVQKFHDSLGSNNELLKACHQVGNVVKDTSAKYLPEVQVTIKPSAQPSKHHDQPAPPAASAKTTQHHSEQTSHQNASKEGAAKSKPHSTTEGEHGTAKRGDKPADTHPTNEHATSEIKRSSSDDPTTQYTLTRDSNHRISNVECPVVPGLKNDRAIQYNADGSIQHTEINALDNKVSAERVADNKFHYEVRDKMGQVKTSYDGPPPVVASNGDVTVPGEDQHSKTVYKSNGAEVAIDSQNRVTHTVNASGAVFDMKYHGTDTQAYVVSASSPTGEAYTLQKSDMGGYTVIGKEGQRTSTASAGAYSLSLPEKIGSFQTDTNGNVFVTHTDWTNLTGGCPHQEIVFSGDGTMTEATANQPIPIGGVVSYNRNPVLWQRKSRDGEIVQTESTDKVPDSFNTIAAAQGWKITEPRGGSGNDWWIDRQGTVVPPSFDPSKTKLG